MIGSSVLYLPPMLRYKLVIQDVVRFESVLDVLASFAWPNPTQSCGPD